MAKEDARHHRPGGRGSARRRRLFGHIKHIEHVVARRPGGRPFRARHPGGPLAAGTGLLLVRPAGVQICPADDAGHHLTGTVADVAFRGRGYDHAIDVPGQGRLTGVFSPACAGRGERVGLRFDPDGCHVFAPPEPGPADPGGPAGPPGQVADGQGAPGRAAAAGPRVT